MARNNHIYYNEDRYKIEEANRIEQLENIVENHTRTERHLEQHTDTASLKNLSDAIIKQSERESNIELLEAKILNDGQRHPSQIEGLEKNYAFAKGYLDHNKDHMNQEDRDNMNEKQQNRRDEMNELLK